MIDGPFTATFRSTAFAKLVGRSPAADVVIGAPWIAELHARLELVAGAHHVTAVDGAVLLGGAPITEAVLHDGDVVRLPDPTTNRLVTLVYGDSYYPRDLYDPQQIVQLNETGRLVSVVAVDPG